MRARWSSFLVSLLLLAMPAAAPGAGADQAAQDPAVSFSDPPGHVRAGGTVPVEFTVAGADGPVSAQAMAPDGTEADLDLREGPEGRFRTQVRTHRAAPGYYEVVIAGEGKPLGSLVFPAFAGAPDAGADLGILHDTHFHGEFEHDRDTGRSRIAQYMSLVHQRKAALPYALFLGNGDDLSPSLLAGAFHGEHMIDALNASPLDVNTFGNHEFDFGPDNLRERITESTFPWVTANVRDIDSHAPFAADLGVRRFVLVDVGGATVGVTGLGPERMGEMTTLGPDTEQIPAIDAMAEVVPEMRAAGAALVVVASHLCGPDARTLAAAVDGIDVIVGDHCAEVLTQPEVINDTIVSFVGDEFDFLGELRVQVESGQVVDHHFTLHTVAVDLPADPAVQAVVEHWEAELEEAFGEVIGLRTNAWDLRTPQVRSGETGFGNYMVDAMRASVGADLGLQNGGGIRSDQIFPGETDIIRRDVMEILPFPNTLVKVALEGSTVLQALEHGLATIPSGRFPHVSGLRYRWDPAAAAGSRIVQVTVAGEPLDPNATYTLATNDFLLRGGGGYTMLAEGEVLIGPDEGRRLSDVVTDQIANESTVTVGVDGRIERIE